MSRVTSLLAKRPRKVTEAFSNDRVYSRSLAKLQTSATHPKLAIVVHLHYVDTWGVFCEKIDALSHIPHSLFITLPISNTTFGEKILDKYPEANIVESPNRGRDVLPFMKVLRYLESNQYEYVLKLHSKKSPHRRDGDEWFGQLIEGLIPAGQKRHSQIVELLDEPSTGIIGPEGQYVSLVVNFEANGPYLTRIMRRVYSKGRVQEVLQQHRGEYGFFAGTMFWARIDAIAPVLEAAGSRGYHYDPEEGQIDATYAHAIERLLGVIPELQGRSMYEIRKNEIKKIEYNSGDIPEWSDHYPGKKN